MSLRLPTVYARRAVYVLFGIMGLGGLWLPGGAAGQTQDPAVTVEITSTPPLAELRPNHDLAHVQITPLFRGQPLGQGRLKATLTAPPVTTFLATGFPRVEGTTLLSLDSALTSGALTLQYVFPLRGLYTLDLELTPVPGGPVFPATRVQRVLHLYEDPAVVRNAWMLLGGLFVLGAIGGFMFARSAAVQEGRLGLALVVLGLVSGVLGSVPTVAADTSHTPASAGQGQQVVQGEQGWTLTVQAQPLPATVGQMVQGAITLRKDGEVFTGPAEVTLVAIHQEEGHKVFETHLVTRQGHTAPGLQFYDGAPHTLTVTARPLLDTGENVPPLSASMEVEVVALHPPTAVKVRMMVILLGVLVLGMVVGFFLPRPSREQAHA